jgi:hypothetical protein
MLNPTTGGTSTCGSTPCHGGLADLGGQHTLLDKEDI